MPRCRRAPFVKFEAIERKQMQGVRRNAAVFASAKGHDRRVEPLVERSRSSSQNRCLATNGSLPLMIDERDKKTIVVVYLKCGHSEGTRAAAGPPEAVNNSRALCAERRRGGLRPGVGAPTRSSIRVGSQA